MLHWKRITVASSWGESPFLGWTHEPSADVTMRRAHCSAPGVQPVAKKYSANISLSKTLRVCASCGGHTCLNRVSGSATTHKPFSYQSMIDTHVNR